MLHFHIQFPQHVIVGTGKEAGYNKQFGDDTVTEESIIRVHSDNFRHTLEEMSQMWYSTQNRSPHKTIAKRRRRSWTQQSAESDMPCFENLEHSVYNRKWKCDPRNKEDMASRHLLCGVGADKRDIKLLNTVWCN